MVEDVEVEKCKNCGEEFIEGKEYERVRLLLEKIKSKTPQPLMSKIKCLIV